MAKPFSSAAARSIGATTFSMLGTDTAITGDIAASADLHVDGRVEGDIACNALVQGDGSQITGSIRAESVRIAGVVTGSVTAREVVILKSARIHGDVTYDALTIEQGARLDGRLSPGGGQPAPTLRQITAPADTTLVMPASD